MKYISNKEKNKRNLFVKFSSNYSILDRDRRRDTQAIARKPCIPWNKDFKKRIAKITNDTGKGSQAHGWFTGGPRDAEETGKKGNRYLDPQEHALCTPLSAKLRPLWEKSQPGNFTVPSSLIPTSRNRKHPATLDPRPILSYPILSYLWQIRFSD